MRPQLRALTILACLSGLEKEMAVSARSRQISFVNIIFNKCGYGFDKKYEIKWPTRLRKYFGFSFESDLFY